MQTKLMDLEDLEEAKAALLAGELIAFPTETVYGLGADATNEQAVAKIFQTKGRPSDNPLIAHIASKNDVKRIVAELPSVATVLMDQFWPGPLTLILKHNGTLASSVTAGLETVGVRMPDHPLALELIKATERPLAAPSANRSGRPSPTTAEHVYEDLAGKVYGIIDGGPTSCGVESTVLDLTSSVPVILRPGAITKEELEQILPEVKESQDTDQLDHPKAPGMKYKHYSPSVPVWMIEETPQKSMDHLRGKYDKIGLLADHSYQEWAYENQIAYYDLGVQDSPESASQHLFAGLRALEKQGVDIILAQRYPEIRSGKAYMNRLKKATAGKII